MLREEWILVQHRSKLKTFNKKVLHLHSIVRIQITSYFINRKSECFKNWTQFPVLICLLKLLRYEIIILKKMYDIIPFMRLRNNPRSLFSELELLLVKLHKCFLLVASCKSVRISRDILSSLLKSCHVDYFAIIPKASFNLSCLSLLPRESRERELHLYIFIQHHFTLGWKTKDIFSWKRNLRWFCGASRYLECICYACLQEIWRYFCKI